MKTLLLISLLCFGWYDGTTASRVRRELSAPPVKKAAEPKVEYQWRGNRYWLKIEQHGTTRVYRGYGVPQWMKNPYVRRKR